MLTVSFPRKGAFSLKTRFTYKKMSQIKSTRLLQNTPVSGKGIKEQQIKSIETKFVMYSMFEVNRTSSVPKSVFCYELDKDSTSNWKLSLTNLVSPNKNEYLAVLEV